MQDDWSARLREELGRLSGAANLLTPSAADKLREGERRKVAVLFLDMTGFTSMAERLDHEAVHQLVTGVMGALARVVELHRGYVDKFEGDRIMALFGAKVAAENDSLRAVSCGLGMLDTIEEINGITGSGEPDIGVRIGIDSGVATVAPDPSGHLTAMGSCVNVASRLEETAATGTIQTTGRVRNECREHFRWEERGVQEVRGIRRAVEVWSPVGHLLEHADVSRGRSRLAGTEFAGREEELGWLRRLWDRLSTDSRKNMRGGAVHLLIGVGGEAGLGKSRLVREFLAGRHRAGDPFLDVSGRSLSYSQPPFQMWSSLLRSSLGLKTGGEGSAELFRKSIEELAASAGDEHVSTALLRSAPYLARIIPVPMDESTLLPVDEESLLREIDLAVRNVLRAMACSAGRLVVSLSDLQWMDPASARVLEFVLGNCDTPEPMVFVCTYRTQAGSGPPVGIRYEGFVDVESMELAPLDEASMGRLACEAVGTAGKMPDDVRDFLVRESEGNPFYLEELVSAMIEAGRLELSGPEWKIAGDPADIRLPDSVVGLMQSRVDLMAPPLKRGVQRASVLGRRFPEELYLLHSEKLDPGTDPAEVLEGLENRGILSSEVEGGSRTFVFQHKLMREAVYGTLLRHNRILMHVNAAGSMEELYPDDLDAVSGSIAWHWEMGGDTGRALEWGMRALERAGALYQHQAVIDWVGKLEKWILGEPVSPDRDLRLLELLDRQRHATRSLGLRDSEMDLIHRMMDLAAGRNFRQWTGRMTCAKGAVFRLTGRTDEAREHFLKSLEIARETGIEHDESYSLDCLGALSRFQGRLQEALDYFDEALEISRRSGDLNRLGNTLNHMSTIRRRLGNSEKAIEYAMKAYDAFVESGNRIDQASALGTLGLAWYRAGDVDEALKCYEKALDIAVETGSRWSEGGIRANLGIFYKNLGRMGEALECYRQAMDIARETGDLSREAAIRNNLGVMHMREGRMDEAMDNFVHSLEIARLLGDRQQQGLTLGNIGSLQRERGEPDSALESYTEALEIIREVGSRPIESSLNCYMGTLHFAAGRTGMAKECYRKAQGIIDELKLPLAGDLKELAVLRRDLVAHGVPERELPWPAHWDPPSDRDDGS